MANIESIKVENNMNINAIGESDEPNAKQFNKLVVFSIKLVLIGLTGVYLLYESIELIKLYYNYSSFVSVYYEINDYNQIPSFTLCLPTIIDRNKLLAKYPDLVQKINESNNEDKRKDILTEYLDKTLDSMIWTELTIREPDAINCTLNYWSIKSYMYSIDYEKKIGLNCREVNKPIESYSKSKAKCFTYFSQLDSNDHFVGEYSLRNGVNNLNDLNEIFRIEFDLDYKRYLTFGFISNETTIAIHNQKMIANVESEAQVLEAGHQYDIIINKITTKLLEKPYKTMCHNYNEIENGIESRKQCIDYCVVELYREKCECIPIQLTNTLQLLNINISLQPICSQRDLSLRSKPCFDAIAEELGLCLTTNRCPIDCQTIRYLFRTKRKKLMTGSEEMDPSITSSANRIVIRVRWDENVGYDTIETHVPLMTFGQLLAHICALITIFSGLSFVGFTNSIVKRMTSTRVMPDRQVSATGGTDSSDVTDNQRMDQKSKWMPEMSKCSEQTECISSCVGSPKMQHRLGTGNRPATSHIYTTT